MCLRNFLCVYKNIVYIKLQKSKGNIIELSCIYILFVNLLYLIVYITFLSD